MYTSPATLLLTASVAAGQILTESVLGATHNSYSGNLDGSKSTIEFQLNSGIRMIEYDTWSTSFSTNNDYSLGHSSVGNLVDHTSPNPASNLLKDWFAVLNNWSDANPSHAPIEMMLDLKSDLTSNDNYASGNPAALNDIIVGAFGDKLVWAQNQPSLAVDVDSLRGRILPVMSGDATTRAGYIADSGSNPSISINSNGYVVEVHDDGGSYVWYWSGKLNANGTVTWFRHGRYDSGVSPAVALNDQNWLVEVHKSQDESELYSHVGYVDPTTCEITWQPSVKYDAGVDPSITMINSTTFREVHQSQSNSQRWQWIGVLNEATSTVTWSQNAETSDPFYNKTTSAGYSVAVNSAGKVVYSSAKLPATNIAYQQVFFVEYQDGDTSALEVALFWSADESETSFMTNARGLGKMTRAWDFDSESDVTNPPANYMATNDPYDSCTRQQLIAHNSDEPLGPGIYGIFMPESGGFHNGQLCADLIGPVIYSTVPTFRRLDEEILEEIISANGNPETSVTCHDDLPRIRTKNGLGTPSEDLIAFALQRDGHRCVFTGDTTNVVVIWLITPAAATEILDMPAEERIKFQTQQNTVTIAASLAEAYNENVFSVDIEDAARIVTFGDLPSNTPRLFTHLPPNAVPDASLLRLSFCWTLKVNLGVHHAERDYSDAEIRAWYKQARADPDFRDPRWSQGIGEHLREVVEKRWADIGDDSESESEQSCP
ncbi:hypothetical protein HMN09_00904100 [Mycena chlorophos]|uniref:Fucose-specific lectin n=1 Tax=Mycena chlorophos TaxID=658473 RepID=A0A8H6SPA4_MYCCL|nr:hypothetical protein HMN09_00904100 [Mycena chlorophos]